MTRTGTGMADKDPDWVAQRRKGNRIIALILFGLVLVYVLLFVARYVIR
jgi:hypothetical protein